jgi:hypothetical protein
MNEINVTIAVEDILSEAALRKILNQSNPNYRVSLCLSKGGNSYLRSKAAAFNQSARGSPFILLTDQDTRDECPVNKIGIWLNGQQPHPNLLFRVAVMEIESWLLADRESFSEFFRVPVARLPEATDEIDNPKEFLVSLARSSTSNAIREDLVPRPRSTAAVGPNYNGRLLDYITNRWKVLTACSHSRSLQRTLERLAGFIPQIEPG